MDLLSQKYILRVAILTSRDVIKDQSLFLIQYRLYGRPLSSSAPPARQSIRV